MEIRSENFKGGVQRMEASRTTDQEQRPYLKMKESQKLAARTRFPSKIPVKLVPAFHTLIT